MKDGKSFSTSLSNFNKCLPSGIQRPQFYFDLLWVTNLAVITQIDTIHFTKSCDFYRVPLILIHRKLIGKENLSRMKDLFSVSVLTKYFYFRYSFLRHSKKYLHFSPIDTFWFSI